MGGPYKLKKRGKPMTTIYDAAILLVDDNPDLLTLVTDNLRTAGYKSVCTAADCAAARAAFAAHRPDLMILDINLPDGDGFGLFRTLRTESDVPALFLSARDADADRLFGLGLGADDYLTKPFLMQELLLRVQHLLQRAYRTELRRSRVLTLGDCTVNLQDAAVRRADGTGYPPAVLHALQTGEAGENTPHILGLHVVEQIIRAHGGTAAFARNAPRGAKAVLVLPVTEDPAAR